MRLSNSLLLLLCTVVVFALGTSPVNGWQEKQATESSSEEKPQDLFNGTSLEGWKFNDKFWRVEEGTIVGQTTEENPTPHNTFLIWEGGEVANFELSFKYRMDGGNSGVQIRSAVFEEYRVRGYQADFDAQNSYTGIWYDEGGRGILVPRCKHVAIDSEGERTVTDGEVSEEDYIAGLKSDDWNEVIVTAKGNTLTHSINGKVSAVLVDNQTDQAESTGIIALQLHQGPPMKIEFKDVQFSILE